MKAFIKKADAETNGYNEKIEIVDLDVKYRTDFAKHFLGEENSAQFITLDKEETLFLAVDEEGLMKNLPLNFFIEVHSPSLAQFGMASSRVDAIVGTAVFIKTKPLNSVIDYEVDNVTADDYIKIIQLLNTREQVELFNKYKQQHQR